MRRIGCLIVLVLLTASCSSGPSTPTAKPTPPFKLTADEERNVDRLLARWEQWNAGVKTFDCRFKRWCYDAVFGRPDTPMYVDLGVLRYAAPDKWLFHVQTTERDGREVAIEPARAEHWGFDGKALVEYSHIKRQVMEHKLPAKLLEKPLLDGPLTFPPFGLLVSIFGFGEPASPFPFGAKAKDLKEQYHIREITPAKEHDQIWLEAFPRTAAMAAGCQRLQLIFRAADMSPVAMKIVLPNAKSYVVYQFYEIAMNAPPSPSGDEPFLLRVPFGWQKIADEPPAVSSLRARAAGLSRQPHSA